MAQRIKNMLGRWEDCHSDPHNLQKSCTGMVVTCNLSARKVGQRSE